MRKTTYDKACIACGEEYTAYRSDTKYCSNECRNHIHYQKTESGRATAKERERITKQTNDILWNNREVLMEHIGKEVSIGTLEEQGFAYQYITRRIASANDPLDDIYFIYDLKCYHASEGTLQVEQVTDPE